MKKFYCIICFMLFIFSSLFVVACNDKPNGKKLNVSYEDIKAVALSETPNFWNKISATRLDKTGEKTMILNKSVVDGSEQVSLTNKNLNEEVILNYIIEKENEKIYCKDNIRYYKSKSRSYLDESEFDGQEFIEQTILEYLSEMYNFFNEESSSSLISSDKKINGDEVIIEFNANLDKKDNTTLKATLTLYKNNLVGVKVQVKSNDKTKELLVSISESNEVVNTPEWFDNDDYKTAMTYEQVKEVVEDDSLFNLWDSAELFLPTIYDGDVEDKTVYTSKSLDKTITVGETYKRYFDGTYLYTYENDLASSKEDLTNDVDKKANYTFDDILNKFKASTFQYFIINESFYEGYYEAGKKYEKDITVISYKYYGTANGVKFESICSLFFDLDNNLYQILCYAKQLDISNPENEILMFEIDISLKKIDTVATPTWFNESDFE